MGLSVEDHTLWACNAFFVLAVILRIRRASNTFVPVPEGLRSIACDALLSGWVKILSCGRTFATLVLSVSCTVRAFCTSLVELERKLRWTIAFHFDGVKSIARRTTNTFVDSEIEMSIWWAR